MYTSVPFISTILYGAWHTTLANTSVIPHISNLVFNKIEQTIMHNVPQWFLYYKLLAKSLQRFDKNHQEAWKLSIRIMSLGGAISLTKVDNTPCLCLKASLQPVQNYKTVPQ